MTPLEYTKARLRLFWSIAVPVICPEELIALLLLELPPSVPSSVMVPRDIEMHAGIHSLL